MLTSSTREICAVTKTWFQEYSYSAKYLLYCTNPEEDELKFDSLKISSPAIGKWVGYTSTSQRILEAYHTSSESLFDIDHDLNIELQNNRSVSVSYNIEISDRHDIFQSSLSFPPSLIFNFDNATAAQAVSEFNKSSTFISFFLGFSPDIKSIEFYGNFYRCTMYYPGNIKHPKKKMDEWVLYPLGWDLVPLFNHSGLPAIPPEAFKNYFDGDDNLQDTISKFVTYREMHNIEDRFLGFFRLLERICLQKKSHINEQQLDKLLAHSKELLASFGLTSRKRKDFESSIRRANSSKYNTEKCISDFIEKLPTEVTEKLETKKSELTNICKLRNDITHANPYSIGRYEIYHYTNFIQSLLFCGLLKKLGVVITTCPALGNRLKFMR